MGPSNAAIPRATNHRKVDTVGGCYGSGPGWVGGTAPYFNSQCDQLQLPTLNPNTMDHIITLALCAFTSCLMAQPVLQSANFPNATTTLNWYALTDPGTITEPSNGVGQTWDFTSATWQLAGTVTWTAAAGTPYASQFPTATHAFITTNLAMESLYVYLLVDASGLQVVAEDVPWSTETYTDYKRVLQTPFAYGNSFSDTNDGTAGPDAETWTYTGAGTLLTTLGSFPNTVKTVRTDDGRVTLWAGEVVFPRLSANSDGVNLYIDAATAIDAVEASLPALRAYPSPTTGTLSVDGTTGHAQWTVRDAQGRTHNTGTWKGATARTLDVSVLVPGAYVLEVADEAGARSVRFIRQ